MTEAICPKCGRQYPKGWRASRRKMQGLAISAALRASKAEGNHIGRKRKIDYASIVRFRKDGLSQNNIARVVNCSRGTVQYALRLLNNKEK